MQYKSVTPRLEALRAAWKAYEEAKNEVDASTAPGGKADDAAWERMLLAEAKWEAIYNAGR
jgi:hypothetical protein